MSVVTYRQLEAHSDYTHTLTHTPYFGINVAHQIASNFLLSLEQVGKQPNSILSSVTVSPTAEVQRKLTVSDRVAAELLFRRPDSCCDQTCHRSDT